MCVDVMMDSGSSISLIMKSFTNNCSHQTPTDLILISAVGEPIPVIEQVVVPIHFGNLQFIMILSLFTP